MVKYNSALLIKSFTGHISLLNIAPSDPSVFIPQINVGEA